MTVLFSDKSQVLKTVPGMWWALNKFENYLVTHYPLKGYY